MTSCLANPHGQRRRQVMDKDIFWRVIPTPLPSPKHPAPKSPLASAAICIEPAKSVSKPVEPVRQLSVAGKGLMCIKDLVPEEKNKIAHLIQEVQMSNILLASIKTLNTYRC